MRAFNPETTLNSKQALLMLEGLYSVADHPIHPRQRALIDLFLKDRKDIPKDALKRDFTIDAVRHAFDSFTDRQFFYQMMILMAVTDDGDMFEDPNIPETFCKLCDELDLSQKAGSEMRAGVRQFLMSTRNTKSKA